jgi:hypothetical protein
MVKNYYNLTGEITKYKTSENFLRRIPSSHEFINESREDVVNNHLLSLVAKEFYFKLPGDNKLSTDKIQLSGTNNLWLNMNSCVLKF